MLQMAEIYVSGWKCHEKIPSHWRNTKYSLSGGEEGEGVHPAHFT